MLYKKLSVADILNLISRYHIIHAIEDEGNPIGGGNLYLYVEQKTTGELNDTENSGGILLVFS